MRGQRRGEEKRGREEDEKKGREEKRREEKGREERSSDAYKRHRVQPVEVGIQRVHSVRYRKGKKV